MYLIPEYKRNLNKELYLSGNHIISLMADVLDKNAQFRFRALGHSMYPFIRNGDIIIITAFQGNSLKLGEVAAFKVDRDDRKLIVHRIIGRKRNGDFILKGDACASADGVISESRILGKVAVIESERRRHRIGLGIERYIIVFFSRLGLIPAISRFAGKFIRVFKRKAMVAFNG